LFFPFFRSHIGSPPFSPMTGSPFPPRKSLSRNNLMIFCFPLPDFPNPFSLFSDLSEAARPTGFYISSRELFFLRSQKKLVLGSLARDAFPLPFKSFHISARTIFSLPSLVFLRLSISLFFTLGSFPPVRPVFTPLAPFFVSFLLFHLRGLMAWTPRFSSSFLHFVFSRCNHCDQLRYRTPIILYWRSSPPLVPFPSQPPHLPPAEAPLHVPTPEGVPPFDGFFKGLYPEWGEAIL